MSDTVVSLTLQGLGRLDDGTLLPRVLPGEEVTVQPDGTARIITPSADRVAAPCRHFKSCGGCALQHASDDFVANWKVEVVKRALTARDLDAPFRTIATSPAQSRRRARFSATRTKKGALVGFHAKASNIIIPIPDCQLIRPGLRAFLPALEALTVIAASRKAEIALTVTETSAGPDILVETEKPLTEALRIELAAFAQTYGVARLTWNDEPVVTLALPVQDFDGIAVTPPPGAFLQATKDGERVLRDAVVETVGQAEKIVDLFAGSGTFSLPLARTAQVTAFEGDASMIDALDHGWRQATGLKQVKAQVRDLFRRPLEPDELDRFDAVVIDPPRAGAEAQIATLANCDVPIIAMVSCNPVTFARDAQTLVNGGYTLNWIQVVDQFRWSPHIELAASFTRT